MFAALYSERSSAHDAWLISQDNDGRLKLPDLRRFMAIVARTEGDPPPDDDDLSNEEWAELCEETGCNPREGLTFEVFERFFEEEMVCAVAKHACDFKHRESVVLTSLSMNRTYTTATMRSASDCGAFTPTPWQNWCPAGVRRDQQAARQLVLRLLLHQRPWIWLRWATRREQFHRDRGTSKGSRLWPGWLTWALLRSVLQSCLTLATHAIALRLCRAASHQGV